MGNGIDDVSVGFGDKGLKTRTGFLEKKTSFEVRSG
jgi:hypothetical protein